MPDPTTIDAVVLLSGGLDSATVLAMARSRGLACLALSFDYGQRHRHELIAAARIADALGAGHRIVTLDPRAFAGSALTDGPMPVPRGRAPGAIGRGIPATYVPARNLVFLAIAVATAESVGARQVHIGVNALDYSGYPDCRPEFIRAIEHAARLGTRAGATLGRDALSIVAPLSEMPKHEIIRTGVALGLDYALTTSCYDPRGRHDRPQPCGVCDACILRQQGFVLAGVPDPALDNPHDNPRDSSRGHPEPAP